MKFVETPLAAIRTATQAVYYAWFVHDAVVRGAITPEIFTDEIAEGAARLRWQPANRTPAGLAGWSWNAVLAAMSISAIAADRALDDTFGWPRPRERTPLEPPDQMNDRDSTRTIMYTLRCAYAHDPLNPRWTCRRPYRGVFRINDLGFEVDTTALNGQPWNIAHVGGQLGYFKLWEYCQELVERGLSA